MSDTTREEVERLLQKLTADVTTVGNDELKFPHVMDQSQEEFIYGEKLKPGYRGGRVPALYQHEVDAIREDVRPYDEIAETYKISITTVQRVKQTGRFFGVPYIARDKIDRRINYKLRAPVYMKDFPLADTDTTGAEGRKRGRKFKHGRAQMSDEEITSMLADMRPAPAVAVEFNVKPSYVRNLRRRHGVQMHQGPALSVEDRALIMADQRDNMVIAKEFGVPSYIVAMIKAGTFPVTP